MMQSNKKDLLVLVADRNMEAMLKGILTRNKSLDLRDFQFDIRRHPEKDPGCRVNGVGYLQPFVNQYNHALIIFDMEGCGCNHESVSDIEHEIGKNLKITGWNDKAAVIIIEPELEIWVWSDSPHVDEALGWDSNDTNCFDWLIEQGFIAEGQIKPDRPKEALEAALRFIHKPRSSSIYQYLAEKVSLQRCSDRSFLKLKTILHNWFSN